MPVSVHIPTRIRVDPGALFLRRGCLESALTDAATRALKNSREVVLAKRGGYVGIELHTPEICWSGAGLSEVPATLRAELEKIFKQVFFTAAMNAGVWDSDGSFECGDPVLAEAIVETFQRANFDPEADTYSIPEYDNQGQKKGVSLVSASASQEPQKLRLVTFYSGKDVVAYIESVFPAPLPVGNKYYGAYGIWAPIAKPSLIWVTGLVAEGEEKGQYLLHIFPLLSGKIVRNEFVPSTNTPISAQLREKYELRFLLHPGKKKGVEYWATKRRLNGGHSEPVFITASMAAPHRDKRIVFGVAAEPDVVEEIIVVGAKPLPRERVRGGNWASFGIHPNFPDVPPPGEDEWMWFWFGWLTIGPDEIRADVLVRKVFFEWELRDERSRFNLLGIKWKLILFYKDFCRLLSLDMLATSKKNMADFLAWLDKNEEQWLKRFAALIQSFREPAKELYKITSELQRLKNLEELNKPSYGDDEDPFTIMREARLADEYHSQRLQLEASSKEQRERLVPLFELVQSLEPLLVLLTIRDEKTLSIEEAIVWAADQEPKAILQFVRDKMQFLIKKNEQAVGELTSDIAAKLQFVRAAAGARLQLLFEYNPYFKQVVEEFVKGPSWIEWVGLGIGLLIATFLFPPAGLALSAVVGVGLAYNSVGQAVHLWRLRGTRLSQYGFAPIVSEEEVQAAILQATVDVIFAAIDVGAVAAAGAKAVRPFFIARQLERTAARETAGALGRSLERLLLGWRRLEAWPPELIQPMEGSIERWVQGSGRAALTAEKKAALVRAIQEEMLARYERNLIQLQKEFETALLQPEGIGDVQAWLTKKIPMPEAFFNDLLAKELRAGKSLWEGTVGRFGAGLPFGSSSRLAAFMGKSGAAELQQLDRELGGLADLLTPNRLYALGRSTGLEYPALARQLRSILSRVEGTEAALTALEDALVGRKEAAAVLDALSELPNPRAVLEKLSADVLDVSLAGGPNELFRAMEAPSSRGTVARIVSDLDQKGGRQLFREVKDSRGHSLFERWDDATRTWEHEPGIRPPKAVAGPRAALTEAERVAAIERITKMAGERTAGRQLTAGAKRIRDILERIHEHPQGGEILNEVASVLAREKEEYARGILEGLVFFDEGMQGLRATGLTAQEFSAVADFLTRGGEGRALAALLTKLKGQTYYLSPNMRLLLEIAPHMQPNELRGISVALEARGFGSEAAEKTLFLFRSFKDEQALRSIFGTLDNLGPRSEGLGRLIGNLSSFEENLNQGALGQLKYAKQLLDEHPAARVLFEEKIVRGGAVIREIDIRLVTPYTRVTVLDVEIKEITSLFVRGKPLFEEARIQKQFAEDIRRGIETARQGEKPLARIRWAIREPEIVAKAAESGISSQQLKAQIRDQLLKSLDHPLLNPYAAQKAALRDEILQNTDQIIQFF
ncbi:MAG TPA: hypothetical protein VFN26_06095 [Candidatus Acidoferrum sp.]|nr:hypothetical protein [Candidatus Acidoferrum sp.]